MGCDGFGTGAASNVDNWYQTIDTLYTYEIVLNPSTTDVWIDLFVQEKKRETIDDILFGPVTTT